MCMFCIGLQMASMSNANPKLKAAIRACVLTPPLKPALVGVANASIGQDGMSAVSVSLAQKVLGLCESAL